MDRFQTLMEDAGRQYIPACDVTYEIISPPNEEWPF